MNKKRKFIAILIIILICFIGLNISLFNIMKWNNDSNKTKKQIDNINDIVEIEEVTGTSDNTEIIKQEEIDENHYLNYINMNLINVNFDDLKSINSDTLGWIQVNGTTINYPFVQVSDNNYYLNHSFDKSYNRAGWVFLD